jgi:hypothetical protein
VVLSTLFSIRFMESSNPEVHMMKIMLEKQLLRHNYCFSVTVDHSRCRIGLLEWTPMVHSCLYGSCTHNCSKVPTWALHFWYMYFPVVQMITRRLLLVLSLLLGLKSRSIDFTWPSLRHQLMHLHTSICQSASLLRVPLMSLFWG